MHSDPAFDVKAQGTNLFVAYPYPGKVSAPGCLDSELGQPIDDHLLQQVHENSDAKTTLRQRNQRVNDQLTGPMVRREAAALGLMKREPAFGEHRRRRRSFGQPPPCCNRRRVL